MRGERIRVGKLSEKKDSGIKVYLGKKLKKMQLKRKFKRRMKFYEKNKAVLQEMNKEISNKMKLIMNIEDINEREKAKDDLINNMVEKMTEQLNLNKEKRNAGILNYFTIALAIWSISLNISSISYRTNTKNIIENIYISELVDELTLEEKRMLIYDNKNISYERCNEEIKILNEKINEEKKQYNIILIIELLVFIILITIAAIITL